MTWPPDVWPADLWPNGGAPDVIGSGSLLTEVYTGTGLPTVSLTINGEQVEAEALTWDSAEGEGFRSCSATIARSDALRLDVRQGATVSVWESAAECQFDGMLIGPPRLRTDGKADFTASGWYIKAEKLTDPLCYQTRDTDLDDARDEPFELTGDFKGEIEAETRPAAVLFTLERNETFATGDAHWLAKWQPGVVMTRYALSIVKNAGNVDFDLRTRRFEGPAGANTLIADHSLGPAGPTTVDQAITSGQDAILLGVRCNNGNTISNVRKWRVKNFRLNARHPNGTGPTGDTWTVRDIVDDVGVILGFDTSNLTDDTENMLPWWSAEGESFLDNLTAATDLTDDHFGFYERGKLVAGSWDDSPTWYVRNGMHVDMSPNVIYSQVQVTYDSPKGKPKRVVATNATALARYGLNVYEFELPDPQPNSTLAEFVADELLAVVSEESFSGTITTPEYRDASGAMRPYGPRPGHKVCIEDWMPGKSLTCRITSTSAAQGEPMTLGLEGAEANTDRILFNAPDRKKGRRRHRKRARGKAGGIRKVK